jgi:hypothetical protein
MNEQDIAEKVLEPQKYSDDVLGKLQNVKHIMWALENKIGKQLWITLILEIVGFQEWLIAHPGKKVKSADLPAGMKAVGYYGKNTGM